MRNLNTDFMRIVACFAIVLIHIIYIQNRFINTYFSAIIKDLMVFVAFFFVVSGYFALASINKAKNSNSGSMKKFLWKKFMNFFPYLLAAELIAVPFMFYILQLNSYRSLDNCIATTLCAFFNDVSCLSMLGFSLINPSNVATWYLSGIMVAFAFTYPLIIRFGKSFTTYASPVIVIIATLCILRCDNYGFFGPYEKIYGLLLKGFVESIGMICLGYFSYECVEKLKKIRFTSFGKIFLTVIEIFAWTMLFILIYMHSIRPSSLSIYTYRFLLLLFLMWVGSVLMFSGVTVISVNTEGRPKLEKIAKFMATVSVVVYLCNYVQIHFAFRVLESWSYNNKLLFIAFAIVISSIITYFAGKAFVYLGNIIKNKMILQDDDQTLMEN